MLSILSSIFSEAINESFSALLDDQATSMDVQRLLNAMDKQPNKVQQWQGLAQCQAQVQQEVCVDLLSSIHSELYEEATLPASESEADESLLLANSAQNSASVETVSAFSWRKSLSSITVAATVCAVSLIGFYQWQQPSLVAPSQADVVASSAGAGVSSAQIQQRFQQLMQQRSQQASFSLPASENQWQSIESAQ